MRRLAVLPALLLSTAAVSGQAFQGVVSMRSGLGSESVEMKVHIDGGKVAVLVPFAGPSGDVEARMVLDPGAQKVTMLVAMPMGAARGMKMTMDLQQEADAVAAVDAEIRELGTSQRIAGMSCQDYVVTSEGETSNLCLTEELGGYSIPAMSGRRPTLPGWARKLENRFPLKVWRPDGTVLLEVTGVARGPVPATMFDVNPEGYQDMSGMMPGGRRN